MNHIHELQRRSEDGESVSADLVARAFLDCHMAILHDLQTGRISEQRWRGEMAALDLAQMSWSRACGAETFEDWFAGRITRPLARQVLSRGREALESSAPEPRALHLLRVLESVWVLGATPPGSKAACL